MPKGGKARDYEDEIEKAIIRFRKYPERVLASGNNNSWLQFLRDIGISEDSIQTGGNFWTRVKDGVYSDTHKPISVEPNRYRVEDLVKEYEKGRRYIETTQTGSYYREEYIGREKPVYRDISTGRFIKK